MFKRFGIASVLTLMLVLMLVVIPVSGKAVGTIIKPGATVFIGEEGLDISRAMTNSTASPQYTDNQIGWWASGAAVESTSPKVITIDSSRLTNMGITPSEFSGYTGSWYKLNGDSKPDGLAFYVQDPQLSLDVWDINGGQTVNGKSVTTGTPLTFRVNTNMNLGAPTRMNAGTAYPAVTVNRPHANFSVSGSGATVYFIDASTNVSTAPWAWNFGDGTTSSIQNPFRTYGAPGTYPVVFTASNAAGSSSVVGNVVVSSGTVNVQDFTYTFASNSVITPGGSTGDISLPTIGGYDATNGYIDIKVKTDSGATLTQLYNENGVANYITSQYINSTQFYTYGSNWSTGALVNGQKAYPNGAYTVTVESNLNGMKDNYKNGGSDYVGKTVSQTQSFTIVSDTLALSLNKEAVVRSKPFSVTITGTPNAVYHLWIKGTSSMKGGYDDQPPMITANQLGVALDTTGTDVATTRAIALAAPNSALGYKYQNSGGKYIIDDVSANSNTSWGTLCAANVTLSSSGTRTVEFFTTRDTKDQKYTIRVEGSNYKTDEVDIKVETGTMAITAAGDGTYFLGEEIKLSGTNSESSITYLFITGPNLDTDGASIVSDNPRVVDVNPADVSTLQKVDVNGDNTWSWKWGTANVALDAGTYTVWATSQPSDATAARLATCAYGTVSVVIKKPFISATASQSTVAQGDKLIITGTAEGNPSVGIQIWVLGKNYATVNTQSVNSDASFKYEISQATTADLSPGQYFIVAQHPMQNNQFDVYNDADGNVWNGQLGSSGMKVFKMLGAGSLQGSDAAEALVEAINNPNVDDTYTKFQILIANPYITVKSVPDKQIGDKFTVIAETNLAVDDEVLVEIVSSSFSPTDKSISGAFSGSSGSVKVTKGDNGLNQIVFDVDSSSFKADEYIITESAILQDATGTELFNVMINAPSTAVPTTAPTAVPTPVPTPIKTAVPTPVLPTNTTTTTTTTASPGFEALYAAIGLIVVGFVVSRRG